VVQAKEKLLKGKKRAGNWVKNMRKVCSDWTGDDTELNKKKKAIAREFISVGSLFFLLELNISFWSILTCYFRVILFDIYNKYNSIKIN
jgi:hypothetical protein